MQHKNAYVWGLISKFGPSFIQLFSNVILARLLCPEDFGAIGVLSIVITVATALIDSGLGGSLIKEKTITDTDCSTISTFNFCVGCTLYCLLFVFAGNIEDYFNIEGLAVVARLLSLTFVIGPIGLVPTALLTREIKFKEMCIITITSVSLGSFIAIAMANMGFGVMSLVALQLAMTLIDVLGKCIVSRYFPKIGFSYTSFKRLIPFGIYTSITSILDSIYESLLTTITGKYLNVTHAGYMNQAKKLEESLSSSISKTVANVTFPILTVLKEDLVAFRKEANSIYKTIPILTQPVLFIVAGYSDLVLRFLFGEQWVPASTYLEVLIFSGIFMLFEYLLRSFIKALCAVSNLMKLTLVKRLFGIAIIMCSACLGANYIIWGYLFSTALAFVCNLVLYVLESKENLARITLDTICIVLPSIFVYALIMVMNSNAVSMPVSFSITLAISIAYYIFIPPLFGFNLYKLVKNKSIKK